MLASRRGFLKSLFVAPAIVAVTNIMPVKALDWLTEEGPFLVDSKSGLWAERWTNQVFIDKWKDVLDYETVGYKGKSSFDAGMFYCPYVPLQYSRSVEQIDPVHISLIRRQMPNLIAYDMVGVSPMTAPSAEIFAMRRRYTEQCQTTPGGSSLQYDASQQLILSKGQTE